MGQAHNRKSDTDKRAVNGSVKKLDENIAKEKYSMSKIKIDSMSKIKIDSQTEFVNFPNQKIRGELESLAEGELQKYESCEERRERLLDKLKIDKSQISNLLRVYVEAGKKFGMDNVFNEILGIFSSPQGGFLRSPFLHMGIRAGLVGDLEEEEIQDFVHQIIKICSSAPEACVEEKPVNCKEEEAMSDIGRMKHLLDIMDRHRRGELTSEDVSEVKENLEGWKKDIENLREAACSFEIGFKRK